MSAAQEGAAAAQTRAIQDAATHQFKGPGPVNYCYDSIRQWLSTIDISPECGEGVRRTPSRWVDDTLPNTNHCPLTGFEFDWVRRKHHCRLCGGIFAQDVCTKRAMLPVDIIVVPPQNIEEKKLKKFNSRDPQRLCDLCYEAVQPIQEILAVTNSNAVQFAVDAPPADLVSKYASLPPVSPMPPMPPVPPVCC